MREEFLVKAFAFPPIAAVEDCDAVCAISGVPLTQGCRSAVILSKAMGDVADICRFPSGWLSPAAAQCMNASKVLRGNLLALPHRGLHPFVSQDSATPERPSWAALLRTLPADTPCLAIFTDESKRRLWTSARCSAYGESWRPYLNTGASSFPPHIGRELQVSRTAFLRCLELVETVYAHGFSKYAILEGLLDVSSSKAIQAHGITRTQQFETQLSAWRGQDACLLAVFIAQKSDRLLPASCEEQLPWKTLPCTGQPAQISLWSSRHPAKSSG
jgi:hypothetical protein